MSKWVIGKYIRLSLADQDLMKKENKSESESISHQKALIQNFINGNEDTSFLDISETVVDGSAEEFHRGAQTHIGVDKWRNVISNRGV